MLGAGLWSLLAASSLVLGAFIALNAPVAPRVLGGAMGFGAGALIGSLAYELVPNTRLASAGTWLAFGIGAVAFYAADGAVERSAKPGQGGIPIALGALLDGIPESMVLGMSVAVGGEISVGFLVAVFVSNIPESLSSAGDMRATRPSSWIYRLWITIAVASGCAGAIGYLLIEVFPAHDGRYMQAFAGGAVLTMLADSMMPEAAEKGGRSVGLFTALGFAVAAVLTTLD